MRVFFTTPYSGKARYQPYINEVLAVLRKRGLNVTTPEDSLTYQRAIEKFKQKGLERESAHYAFVTHGIAEADVVIVEATHENFRVGHEVTLALLYGKPTLVLSQHKNYTKYIPHELLYGVKYGTKKELRDALTTFLDNIALHLTGLSKNTQIIGNTMDALHMAALTSLRQKALRDESEFGGWARLAETKPEKAYAAIKKELGDLPIAQPWSVLASIYDDDSPDYILDGVAQFVATTFSKNNIKLDECVVDVMTKTGALARGLARHGYKNVLAFDSSRQMLSEAFRYCAHIPSIKLLESSPDTLKLSEKAKAMAWLNYNLNTALTRDDLEKRLRNLLNNIEKEGCLIFDVRTIAGWHVSFYRQKVTTFATDTFQHIRVNVPDYENNKITFDVFIRLRGLDGAWGSWEREQLTERMWSLDEIKAIIANIDDVSLEMICGDNFSPLSENEDANLAYFVIKKH